MGFWFFKQKKREDYSKQIKTLHSSLKSSFTNVKKDMHNISDWINILDEKNQDQNTELKGLQKRVMILEAKLERVVEDLEDEEILEEPKIEEIRNSEVRFSGVINSFQSLTDTQKNIFKTLHLLQKEKGWAWVLLKDIANEIYPTKSYNAVRSTISDYLCILEEIGLVQRKRVSRQSMVSLTDIGKEFLKYAKEELNFVEKSLESSANHSTKKSKSRDICL